MNVPHDALFQKCINGFAPPNRRAALAPDKKSFEQHVLNGSPKFKTISQDYSSQYPLPKIAQMVPLRRTKGLPELQIRNTFKWHFLLNHWSKFKIHRIFPHDAFYENCTKGSSPVNKGAARALDKICH